MQTETFLPQDVTREVAARMFNIGDKAATLSLSLSHIHTVTNRSTFEKWTENVTQCKQIENKKKNKIYTMETEE